ncbi:hypothetical protein TNCV_3143021 [Trichonephila clavipes]|nr:hypothetical protein TNCV_3143021 [Trichonephila clavipes]
MRKDLHVTMLCVSWLPTMSILQTQALLFFLTISEPTTCNLPMALEFHSDNGQSSQNLYRWEFEVKSPCPDHGVDRGGFTCCQQCFNCPSLVWTDRGKV